MDLLILLGVILAILWLILPFIVMATNKRLDKVIQLIERTYQQIYKSQLQGDYRFKW